MSSKLKNDYADRLRAAARFARLVERHPELLTEGKKFTDAGTPYSKGAAAEYEALQKRTATKIGDSVHDLQAGKITGQDAYRKIQDDLSKAHTKAYTLGKGRMLGKAAALNVDDMFYLQNVMEVESKFLQGYIDDIVNGKTALKGRMSAGTRGDLYSRSLRGTNNNARVEYSDSEDPEYIVKIYWNLSPVESCEDCISLANFGPYTRDNLATCPGCGDTVCGGNCRCSLTFERVRVKKQAKRVIPNRPKAPKDIFKLPPAPRGLTHPTPIERISVEQLRQEVNYWRRVAADELSAGNEEAFKAALGARKKANATLNKFLKKNKLYSPPAFGVDEVISGRVLDDKLTDAIFSLGLDGASIAALPKATYKTVIDEILSEAGVLDAEIAATLAAGPKP